MKSQPVSLSAAHHRQYDEDGFFVLDAFVGDDRLDEARDEICRVWDEARAQPAIDERTAWMLEHRPFLPGLHQRSRCWREILTGPVLQSLAAQLIGPDADLNYSQAVIKPPTTVGNAFNWHQDAYYPLHGGAPEKWDRDKLLDIHCGFMCWLPVTETTVANGTLWIVPGAHCHGLLPHSWDPLRREWQATLDTADRRPVELQPGQLLIFSPLTAHYSGPNTTAADIRMVCQFGIGVPAMATVDSKLPLLRNGRAA